MLARVIRMMNRQHWEFLEELSGVCTGLGLFFGFRGGLGWLRTRKQNVSSEPDGELSAVGWGKSYFEPEPTVTHVDERLAGILM